MTTPAKGGLRPAVFSFVRRFWKAHLAASLAVIVSVAITIAGFGAKHLYACGVKVDTTNHASKVVCGLRLSPAGQRALEKVANSPELGGGAIVAETPPTAEIRRLNAEAAKQAHVKYPTLAAPEPVFQTCPVRNYSDRHGQHPLLWVIHDTESPNVPGRGPPGFQDIRAICAWFNNPASQASSHYTTDGDGNTLLMVARAAKAWTQAGFNAVAVSDEFIGYASQEAWPFAQLYAGEQLAAADLKRYGIPAQHGLVDGQTCRVIRPGIVMHADLGQCGGGHHDAGTHFPVAKFIAAVHRILHPAPPPKPRLPRWYINARTSTPFWAWAAWRDHGHPAKLRPAQIPARVPHGWWLRYARHTGTG